jgi:signal transduction histidine kinase
MLVMASIVTIVSLSDLIGEFSRQFDYALDRAKLVLHYTPDLINREVERSNESNLIDAIAKSPSLPADLFNLAVKSQSVDEIVVTDTAGRVLVDSYPNQAYHPRPDFADLVDHKHWWTKWWVLYRTHESYEIKEDELDPQTNKRAITIHVLLLPALIRSSVAPILQDHAWIAIFSIIFGVLGAFAFASIAFHPLGKLGKMLDLVASGEYELQQVTPSADEFGIVASKVSLLGQQLRGAQTEFSDLKGNFERLLDEIEDAVLIFGRDRCLIAAAGAVEAFLPRSRPELVGQSVNEVFPPATSVGLLVAQAMQLGRPVRNRAVPIAIEKNGTSQLKVVLLAVEFLEQSGMLIRLRDPEATRQIGRQLQTADRLSAISRLTGGVAHEVKNPLNAILMHVEVAKLKLAGGDYDLGPQMDVLSSEILRLDRVVKTFLDFTRPVQLNLTEVSLADFVIELAELARPQAEASNIEVTVEAPQEPVSITVDQDLFKQAVLNIVVNAIEAMPDGGQLSFRAGVHGDQAEIRISDTGPGIPADVRDKIYNLYFTTKETGSGIGLSMTFRIIQLHDGTIDLESEPGHGTTFSLRVPLAVLNG